MIMKKELIAQNVHKAYLNDMKHDACYSATQCSIY